MYIYSLIERLSVIELAFVRPKHIYKAAIFLARGCIAVQHIHTHTHTSETRYYLVRVSVERVEPSGVLGCAAAAAAGYILTFALLDSIHAKADWVRCPLLPLCMRAALTPTTAPFSRPSGSSSSSSSSLSSLCCNTARFSVILCARAIL